MAIELPPDLYAAVAERAECSNLTAEQFVIKYLTNLLKPFDPYDDRPVDDEPTGAVATGAGRP